MEIIAKSATKTGFPMLRTYIERRPDGQYLVDSNYYDSEGYYIAHKSSKRIVPSIDDLIK